jgi:hypothetical protein
MRFLYWLIHGESLAHRASLLVGCVGLVLLSCLFHGQLGRSRVQGILEGMSDQGMMTGVFWRVSHVETRAVVVTGYQRVIRIQWPEKGEIRSGDRLSFVIRRKPGETDWVPEKVRVHGKAGLKYAVSFFAVAWVFFFCVRHVRMDRENTGLKFNQGRRSCRTD